VPHELAVNLDRDDLAVEVAAGRGVRRPPVRFGGEGVELVSAEAPLVGDELRRDALVHEAFGVPLADAGGHLRTGDARAERHPAHRLDARRDHDVVRARHDPLGGEVRRLLARSALAVDRGRRHGLVEAGGEHGLAPDVEGLLADLADASHDDVVDLARFESVALEDRGEHVGGEIHRMHRRQRAARLSAAGRRAHDVDDDGFLHHCGGSSLWGLGSSSILNDR
jgi:hypothetical protein